MAAPMMVAPTLEEAPEDMEAPLEAVVVAPKKEAPAAARASGSTASVALAKPIVLGPVRMNAMRTPASLIVQDGSPLRWAGALLLAGVLLSLVEMGLLRARFLIDGDQLGGRLGVVLIDAALGTLLVRGREQYRQLASMRAILGGVMFTLMHLIEGHTFLAIGQVLYSAILLTLLSAWPQRDRVRMALSAALGLFLVQTVGIHLMLSHKQRVFAAEQNLRRTEALQRYSTR